MILRRESVELSFGTASAIALSLILILSFPVSMPADAVATKYKFAVGGDDGFGDISPPAVNAHGEMSQEYVASMKENGIQRFFELGDLTMEQGPSAYVSLAHIYNSSGIPYNITLGNHDKGFLPNGCDRIFDYHGWSYEVRVGEVVFLVMHSTTMEDFNESTIAWLDEKLSAHMNEICFIMMHIMHRQVGYPAVEVEDNAFIRLVGVHRGHIGAIIGGHIHEYNTPRLRVIDGVRYAYTGTVGTGYVPMNPEGIYSYLTIELEGAFDEWTIHMYRINIQDDTIVIGTEDSYAVNWGDDSHAADAAVMFGVVVLLCVTIAYSLRRSNKR